MAAANAKFMWHEARQQDKFLSRMLVDYEKRAERRKEYYDKIKLEPHQFLQVHGRSMKIHLDPSVYMAAEGPGTMLPWRGEKDNLIDRFDVRAHLDDLPETPATEEWGDTGTPVTPSLWEDRQLNYERYRILVQNNFMGFPEEKFLQQIRTEELYGPSGNVTKTAEEEKKALAPKRAAIGYTYEGGEPPKPLPKAPTKAPQPPPPKDEDSDSDHDSDIDLDMTLDVMQLDNSEQLSLNVSGCGFGLRQKDFMELISRDLQEAEELRQVKLYADEKALLSVR